MYQFPTIFIYIYMYSISTYFVYIYIYILCESSFLLQHLVPHATCIFRWARFGPGNDVATGTIITGGVASGRGDTGPTNLQYTLW